MAQGGGRVAAIEPCSPAAEAGLLPGDCICAVSDRPLRDRIDFEFLTAEDNPILTISRAGKVTQITVMKDAEEPTGVSFEDDTFDGIRRCRNHCRFCFVDAQPAGLRPSLYVKDDDFRYSFIYGSFLTLTNLNEEDWARLAEQRLSPLYISVHSTNDQLRALLLGRKSTPSIVAQLRRLAALGITLHTQVVVCPGLNDGQELERTLDDLQTLWPAVQSVAIVPVGITRFSRDPLIRTHSDAEVRSVVRLVRAKQRRLRRELGVLFVYLADEYYLRAGVRLPVASRYDGFPQYENGIGLSRTLIDEWHRIKRRRLSASHPATSARPAKRLTVVTGALASTILTPILAEMNALTGTRLQCHVVQNSFFGESVTVTGLLTGTDVVASLRKAQLNDGVILPAAMFNRCHRSLDDSALSDIASALDVPTAAGGSLTDILQLAEDTKGNYDWTAGQPAVQVR